MALVNIVVQNGSDGAGRAGGRGEPHGPTYHGDHPDFGPEGIPVGDGTVLNIIRHIKDIAVNESGAKANVMSEWIKQSNPDYVAWDDARVIGAITALRLVLGMCYVQYDISAVSDKGTFEISTESALTHHGVKWNCPSLKFSGNVYPYAIRGVDGIGFDASVVLSAKRLRVTYALFKLCLSGSIQSPVCSEKRDNESGGIIVNVCVRYLEKGILYSSEKEKVFELLLDSKDPANLATISSVDYKKVDELCNFIKGALHLNAQLPPPAAGCATLRAWQAVERRVDRLVILERP